MTAGNENRPSRRPAFGGEAPLPHKASFRPGRAVTPREASSRRRDGAIAKGSARLSGVSSESRSVIPSGVEESDWKRVRALGFNSTREVDSGQIPPLRFAPVGMTLAFQTKHPSKRVRPPFLPFAIHTKRPHHFLPPPMRQRQSTPVQYPPACHNAAGGHAPQTPDPSPQTLKPRPQPPDPKTPLGPATRAGPRPRTSAPAPRSCR